MKKIYGSNELNSFEYFFCEVHDSLCDYYGGVTVKCIKNGEYIDPPWRELPEKNRKCRYCDIEVKTRQITHGYWQGLLWAAHKECCESGEKQEAIECQSIDADCNDCKWFKRGNMIAKGVFEGHCLKFNKPCKAYPKQATCMLCFEHRKIV